MSVDAAFEQLRKANPEPDPAALRRQLHDIGHPTPLTQRRSDTMETRTPTIETRPPAKSPRRWIPALVAGALVLLLGVPFLILRDGGGLFGLFGPTPVEIAESYMEARNAWDASAARSLLADDVVMNDVPMIENLEELEPGFEALRVYEFQFSSVECAELVAGPPASVRCDYMMDTNLQQIVGYPPVPGSFTFGISDGRIASLTHNFNFGEFGENAYDPFLTWLDSEHPGAFDQIYRMEGSTSTPRLTPEALDLARTYVAEYDESLNGSGG